MGILHAMSRERPAGGAIGPVTRRRVWGYARPYRTMVVGFLVTVVASSLLGVVPPLLFREIIDGAIANGDRGYLTLLGLLIVVAALTRALLSFVERWFSATVGEGLIYDLRLELFDHVQRLPISFFTRTQTGALVSRLNNDVIGAQRALTGTLGTVVANSITAATTLATMFVLEWRITLMAMTLLPLFVLPARRVGQKVAEITREGMDLNASMNATMTERFNVAGAQLVKLFGRHDEERDDFGVSVGRVRDIGILNAMYGRAFVIALTLLGALGTAAVYWVGGSLAISGTLTIGTLASMGVLVTQLYLPLAQLTNARVDVMSAFVSFERVFEVLDTRNPIADAPDAVALEPVEGVLRFEGVSFAYPTDDSASVSSLEAGGSAEEPGRTVLHGINLTVDPGQMLAIVGPTGSGKSTLASLIPRLYDVTGGAVTVDGHDIRSLRLDQLRSQIGVVTQDPHLFHETVGQNLRYARPAATAAEMDEACAAARILEVIRQLPDGYDTIVGERGYRLSGGEKQRLAIARLLLKDPRIVVLDEATSHLDTESEALVQAALSDALAGRTSIVIAHRLSTIVEADEVIVLDEGRIVERGRHRDLREAGGLYADLWETLVRAEQNT
ncbi:MAG: ABC transporter ATP-binding protein [Actinobacteria bacterium]|nr:ABC transporter ATP-binding protein [Actinomycetota bacterium]MBT3687136.1 ABC transporter ATP-binding protein [Actinomycetota bacterium]MBT4037565.1 ABC transporter ATP-binding protein [Actinomycetota bacterium]MBT4279865.1 ABC transporter ATP-binding protein [Actinomycetota bacterium]MBT4342588.1 ABC transporter ATP-binding protein [Actinomycetota bacterium]